MDIRKRYWRQKDYTPENVFWNRRRFLLTMGALGAGLISGCNSRAKALEEDEALWQAGFPEHGLSKQLYPAKQNERYSGAEMPTEPKYSLTYNNFYEFSLQKDVYRHVSEFEPFPWKVEVTGLCKKPKVYDIDDLLKAFELEERIYRFRCVEAWSMVVPWSGFPLADLLKKAEPESDATHVRFTSFHRPEQAPGQSGSSSYTWPYYEGIRLDEAMNSLAFVATGVYGKPLPKQSGAPIRIILPWKYGYKGTKSVVKIELVKDRPHTFWNDAQPKEYGFYSNVDPTKPHPRWSQATERRIDTGERIVTLPYNGYVAEVADLYTGKEL